LVRDGEEYLNLMPVWDWEHLPGVTSFKSAYKLDRKPFVGGVSNGKAGLSVMDYLLQDKENKQTLSAHKFWASHNNLVVCLIAGLETWNTDEDVFTTLDQCRWRGEVCINKPGQFIKEGEDKIKDVKWIYHSGFAYIPLKPASMGVMVKTVSGTWKSINNSLPDTLVREKVFMPVILHGSRLKDQSTGYVLASCASAGQAQLMARQPQWKIICNDSSCQAISFSDGTLMAAFFVPGSLSVKGRGKLTVDKPCLLMISNNQLYASDPLHKGEKLTVQLNQKNFRLQLSARGYSTEGIPLK
jgi:chondroitin AC lyase